MMKQAKFIFLLIAALAFASCRPTARQVMADAEQPTDSTVAVTNADSLRLVIADKSISRSDSVVQARIINPNDYDVNYGQEYTIERETDGHWQQVPFPKDFGFTSVLSTVAAHDSATVYGHIRLFHLAPGHYRLTKQIDGHTLSDDFYIPSTTEDDVLTKLPIKPKVRVRVMQKRADYNSFDGSYYEANTMLAKMVWQSQPEVKQQIVETIGSLSLPCVYSGVQIRGRAAIIRLIVSIIVKLN